MVVSYARYGELFFQLRHERPQPPFKTEKRPDQQPSVLLPGEMLILVIWRRI